MGFSWTGISLYSTIQNQTLLIVLSLVIGIVFVLLFFTIIKQVQRLAEDNSFQIANTINHSAEVYLTIPGNKSGKGKIMISVKGYFHELDAITEGESVPSISVVKVFRIENNNILIVEKI